MKLLALDQASKTTGYAVFIDGKLETYGKFTYEDSDIGIRLNRIRNKVSTLVADYDIDQIVFEDIQLQANVGNNVATFKVLAEVFGVIEELATELEIPHSAVLASVWKSTLKIRGASRPEQKRNAQAYVSTTYGVKATQDECDAICIGAHTVLKGAVPQSDFDWS